MKFIINDDGFMIETLEVKLVFGLKQHKNVVEALKSMGVTRYQLSVGLDDMHNKNNRTAHFGLKGEFLFSK